MSYNQDFYNNFHGNTFQNEPTFLPPPPPPPAFFIPPRASNMHDGTIVKQFESKLPRTQLEKPKCSISISAVRDEICNLVLKLKKLKSTESMLTDNINNISDDEWSSNMRQEEQAKCQADIILKETLRKKHDAKKYIVKLDALIKLRKARMNTAKGRGESVSEAEADTFNNNIGK
ncbi:DNA double-strand break repair Rad50 ATPase [Operophtera brumata]|uniref:DNA double-strand break repair Rad50 ATPase n=1 Tax=Operophtera brumata TaxID=104452 RepID=A0A0L7L134_OPEBR|nr:DNA double-strand break repair Rad50 ATPase [Operophtera brumata]